MVDYDKLTDNAELIAWSMAWEGSIGISRGKNKYGVYYRPMLQLSNSNKELLEEFHRLSDMGYINIGSKKNDRHKTMWQWHISNQSDSVYFINAILPFLPSKVEQAELLRDFCLSRMNRPTHKSPYTEEELSIIEKIHELNRKGSD